MSKEMFFFATKSDLLQGLKVIEANRKLLYTKTGAYDSIDDIKSLSSFVNYENLGININGDHQSLSFLVHAASKDVIPRQKILSRGATRYFIDQELNQSSIAFWPSGIYDNKFLICGHVSTVWDEIDSVELYKQFSKELVKGFKKFKRYYVGPEALELSKSMRLITGGINQPEIFDLKIE